MNRYLLLAVMIFLTLFLSTGCGQLLVAIGGAEAVLLQAEGNLENEKGFSYKGEGKGTISEPSGMSIEIEQEGTYRFVWDPYGVHVEETIKAFGGPLKQEYYITDKEGYEWVEGEGWQKITIDRDDIIHKYDPRVALRFLYEAGEHTEMEEKDGMYILQADLSGEQTKKLMKDFYDELLDEMVQNLEEEIITTEDLKFSRIKYQVWVDSKTFIPEKYNLIHEIEGNVDGDVLEIQLDLTFTKDGKVEEIAIPDEVKEEAR